MKAIIVDLDGTLADNGHRREYIEGDSNNWKKYYEELSEDPINKWCLNIIRRFIRDHKVFLVTGREGTENIRKDTKVWLAENNVPYDDIYFRPKEDYREDSEVKKEILNDNILTDDDLRNGIDDIEFAIDDRLQVIEMWRDLGITVLDCAGGEF